MKKTILTIVLAALCLFLSSAARAQTVALKIGDQVPDMTINNIINYKSSSAKLSDFKGKLLILDFWATWCGACIKNFPRLDSLQNKYTGQMQVLLVNDSNSGDSEEKIRALFAKRKSIEGRAYQLPYFIGDTLLAQLFPHRLLPHCVWIGPDGRVKAITSSEELTGENILQMVSKESPNLTQKKDFDTKKPLFFSDSIPDGLLQYSVFLKGRIEGLSSGNIYRRKDELLYGRAMTNTPLLSMYENMAIALLKKYNRKLMLVEVANPSKISTSPENTRNSAWMKENAYTMEVILPLDQSASLYPIMLEQLNHFSGYKGNIETRRIKCLVLSAKGSTKNLVSKGGKTQNISFDAGTYAMSNRPLSHLVNSLNIARDIKLQVIDETGFSGQADISLSGSPELSHLRKDLKAYGLDLQEAERDVEVFILRDNPVANIK